MKRLLLIFGVLLSASAMKSPLTGREVFTRMHEKYSGNWYKTFSFSQTTEIYKNDSLKKTETWYENIRFPQNFRIDFGNLDSGNAVIFHNDSSYVFRGGKKLRTSYYPNDILFLLGGMYFYPLEEGIAKMASFGFDLGRFHEGTWKGKGVYVIGASRDGDHTSQVWFDKEHYNLVRMIKYENKQKEEAVLENHVRLNGGFSETLVHFYINDQLVQVERYHDLKANVDLDPGIFDPSAFKRIPR